ncbi:hypothetical protein AIOL_001738 [Candidatus Rhodobacter oscarellae]|uniref:Glycosyltransferase n=1 Tax=Candidatus Rhodobacter oscarellae TaxID=1675527 RepID=A0A0J9E265_9RHOB|nr:hypothetical protein [Candidatus Rhodobacter lobularis]KMW56782.1 hypothetical protein AIOL_001738 [Candidatus Rhodobacter lobularis]
MPDASAMTAILILLPFALLAGLAVWLHHLFEGEWLPHDLLREWHLSRRSLTELDAAWAAAPERSEIVITLTTTPSRIGLLKHTLRSLLDQSRPPARIVLNVPGFSLREQLPYQIPPELHALRALEIRRSEDLGPGTKLIPTLAAEAPDTPLLVLDDDRIYPKWLVACYEAMAARQPDYALTMGGWVVPADLTDRFTTIRSNLLMQPPAPIRAPRLKKPREVDVMLGVFSYLVRPRFFDLAEISALEGPEALRYVDDVRTSALCCAPKFVIPAPSLSFVPWSKRRAFQSTRLGLFNRGMGGGTRHNTVAIQHYADRWRVGGPKAP